MAVVFTAHALSLLRRRAIPRMLAEESDEQKLGSVFDYNACGNVLGIEILAASKKVENPAGAGSTVAR